MLGSGIKLSIPGNEVAAMASENIYHFPKGKWCSIYENYLPNGCIESPGTG